MQFLGWSLFTTEMMIASCACKWVKYQHPVKACLSVSLLGQMTHLWELFIADAYYKIYVTWY